MTITFKRVSYGLGAVVQGVDLRKPLSDADVATIRQGWLEHNILLFRDQDITPEQHIAFSARFGKLDDHDKLYKYRHPEHAEIFIVTTRPKADGSPSDTRETGVNWHSDMSYTLKPATGSLLYCVEIPEVGGDTMFSNTYLAYDTLSDGMKKLIDPLWAVHSYAYAIQDTEKGRNPEVAKAHIDANPPVMQPMVRMHPETGRKALYVSEGATTQIVGMSPDESNAILQYLFRHSVIPEYTYRHQWRPRDLVMWDNRQTMHRARPFDETREARDMRRTTIAGDAPTVAQEAA